MKSNEEEKQKLDKEMETVPGESYLEKLYGLVLGKLRKSAKYISDLNRLAGKADIE